jgi:hypothetical protein
MGSDCQDGSRRPYQDPTTLETWRICQDAAHGGYKAPNWGVEEEKTCYKESAINSIEFNIGEDIQHSLIAEGVCRNSSIGGYPEEGDTIDPPRLVMYLSPSKLPARGYVVIQTCWYPIGAPNDWLSSISDSMIEVTCFIWEL